MKFEYVPQEASIPDFVGAKVAPQQQAAAIQAAQPWATASQTIRTKSAQDEEQRKAEGYRQVLSGGPDLMYKFADEVSQKYPELGQQLHVQVDGYAPLFKNPNLDADKVKDVVTDFYKNSMDRINQIDKGSKVDPLLELKKQNLQSMIDSRRIRDKLAKATQGRKSKSVRALASAWELADEQYRDASKTYEDLLGQTTGTHSPKWQQAVDQAQMAYNKAQQYRQTILEKVDAGDWEEFTSLAPSAKPNKAAKSTQAKADPLGLR